MMLTKNRSGYTLIEILVVITILGILIGILMPVLHKAREHARATECKSNLKQLYVACLSASNDGAGRIPYAASFEASSYDEETQEERFYEVKGWIQWDNYPEYPSGQDYHTRSEAGNARQPQWWGSEPGVDDNAYASITNGTLWSHTGKRIKIYCCPTFRRHDVCAPNGTMPDDTTDIDPVRSYAMNSRMSGASLLSRNNASRVLVFADVGLMPEAGVSSRGFLENNPDAYDGVLTSDDDSGPEAIGSFHSMGRGNVVFADGHIEFTHGSNTYEMCTGDLYP